MTANIDPVCLVHGKRKSEHECLYCCICFKPLASEECSYLPDGSQVDMCVPCAEEEQKTLVHLAQKATTRKSVRTPNIERDAMGRLAVTYWKLDRRNGNLGWGPVWTLFDRRKPLHWLVAIYVLLRDGDGVRREKTKAVPR